MSATFIPRLHLAAGNLRCGHKQEALKDIREELNGGMTYRQVADYMTKHCKCDMTVEDLKELLNEMVVGFRHGAVTDVVSDAAGVTSRMHGVVDLRLRNGGKSVGLIFSDDSRGELTPDYVLAHATWGFVEDVYADDVARVLVEMLSDRALVGSYRGD